MLAILNVYFELNIHGKNPEKPSVKQHIKRKVQDITIMMNIIVQLKQKHWM